jgi:dTDP-N-acetylfucosamine:lipid II N-acetylfucosaminyltransferase
MHADKFVAPFIDFIEEHFVDFSGHQFFIFGDEARYPVRKRANISLRSEFDHALAAGLALALQMNRAQQIILHGLFNKRVVQLLCIQPWLLKRCHWVIWGGDLYIYQLADQDREWHIQEFFRRFVIKRLGHLVTCIDNDVMLARQWYGARGIYHQCFVYPSNLYKKYLVPTKTDDTIHIQIGNSADPDNEHFEMLESLKRYKDESIKIYAPLSYGDPIHAQRVREAGVRLFGDKFVALQEYMAFDKYLKFLGMVDIALFNHRRQQGMGNMITLLGLGKKVYLRPVTTSWALFEKIGVKVYDNSDFDLTPINGALMEHNQKVIKNNFSEPILIGQLQRIFKD